MQPSYLDRIKAQRQAEDQQNSYNRGLDTTRESGQDVVRAIHAEGSKNHDVTVTNPDMPTKSDIDKLIDELKQNQLATLMGAQNAQTAKPHQVISDSAAYIGSTIDDLEKKLLARLDDPTSHDELKSVLSQLQATIGNLDDGRKGDTTTMSQTLQKITDAIEGIDVQPVVHVDAPKVSVAAPKIDLKPLQATLEKYFNQPESEDNGIDLDDYRAQDITNAGNDMQYVGFVNPEGAWYIIENDIKANAMRYVFGSGNYAKAFKKASSYQYYLLNEAIDNAKA